MDALSFLNGNVLMHGLLGNSEQQMANSEHQTAKSIYWLADQLRLKAFVASLHYIKSADL